MVSGQEALRQQHTGIYQENQMDSDSLLLTDREGMTSIVSVPHVPSPTKQSWREGPSDRQHAQWVTLLLRSQLQIAALQFYTYSWNWKNALCLTRMSEGENKLPWGSLPQGRWLRNDLMSTVHLAMYQGGSQTLPPRFESNCDWALPMWTWWRCARWPRYHGTAIPLVHVTEIDQEVGL